MDRCECVRSSGYAPPPCHDAKLGAGRMLVLCTAIMAVRRIPLSSFCLAENYMPMARCICVTVFVARFLDFARWASQNL